MAQRPRPPGFSVSRRLSERSRAAERPGGGTDATFGGALGGMVEAFQALVGQLVEAAKSSESLHDQSGHDQSGRGQSGHDQSGWGSAEPEADRMGPEEGVRSGGPDSRTVSAVFGYTLRMGLDGVSAEPFGDVPQRDPPAPDAAAPTRAGNAAPAARQPIVDVFEEPGAITVVAELPGADPEGLMCSTDGWMLLIEAAGPRRYRKQVNLPAEVKRDEIRTSLQNGILEVRLVPVTAP